MTRTGSTSELVSASVASVSASQTHRIVVCPVPQPPSHDTSTSASTSVSVTCRSCTVDLRTEVSALRTTEMLPVR